jgi:hypothetical protein
MNKQLYDVVWSSDSMTFIFHEVAIIRQTCKRTDNKQDKEEQNNLQSATQKIKD